MTNKNLKMAAKGLVAIAIASAPFVKERLETDASDLSVEDRVRVYRNDETWFSRPISETHDRFRIDFKESPRGIHIGNLEIAETGTGTYTVSLPLTLEVDVELYRIKENNIHQKETNREYHDFKTLTVESDYDSLTQHVPKLLSETADYFKPKEFQDDLYELRVECEKTAPEKYNERFGIDRFWTEAECTIVEQRTSL